MNLVRRGAAALRPRAGRGRLGWLGWLAAAAASALLGGVALGGSAAAAPPAEAGRELFDELGCATCHTPGAEVRCPTLVGVAGNRVELANGTSVVADDAYLRESILRPQARVVRGFQPIMPSFEGLVSDEELAQLISYLKSLAQPAPQPARAPAAVIARAGSRGSPPCGAFARPPVPGSIAAAACGGRAPKRGPRS